MLVNSIIYNDDKWVVYLIMKHHLQIFIFYFINDAQAVRYKIHFSNLISNYKNCTDNDK